MSKKYPKAFKEEALTLLESSGKTVLAVAEELGVNASALYRWRRERRPQAKQAAVDITDDTVALAAEVKRLEKEMEILRQERDILKKAISICSRERQ